MGEPAARTVKRPVEAVLVVDDDDEYIESCRHALRPRVVHVARNADEALATLEREDIDLALIDLFIEAPGVGPRKPHAMTWGIDMVADLRSRYPDLLMVLVSSGNSIAFAESALENGADAAVPKQHFPPEKLIALLEKGRLLELIDSCTPPTPMSLARMEREYVAERYVANDRNIKKTAKELNVARSTIYKILRTWRE